MSEKKWTPEQEKVIRLRKRNILVSAAAGSGKTAVLVQRIIEMITDPQHPMDIDALLVVTFTNAAAREMKERIRDAITKALEQDPGNTHLMKQETLVGNANICTIDSFCLQVIRNHFHEIGLDPEFRTADQNEIKLMKQTLMDAFLEEKYEEADPAFLDLVSIYGKRGKDTDVKDMIFRLMDVANSFPWPMKWLEQAKAGYEISSVEELKQTPWMQEEMRVWTHKLEEIKTEYNNLIQFIIETPGAPEARIAILRSDLLYVERLLESGNVNDFLLRVQEHGRFDAYRKLGKDDTSNPDMDAWIKAERESYRDEIKNVEKLVGTQSLEVILYTLQITKPIAQELLSLTEAFMQRFAEEKQRKNVIDFTDQEHFALQILVDEETGEPRQAAKEYQLQFQEVMIDEYQDSNDVQEWILSSVSKMPLGEYNYFMVGDVKQSIYGFRMARPRIFMDKYARYEEQDAKEQRIDLNKNFRSRKEVLDFTNMIFEALMQEDLGGVGYGEKEALYYGASYYEKADKAYAAMHPEAEVSQQVFYQPELLIGTYDNETLDQMELEDRNQLEAKMIAERIQKLVYQEQMLVYDQEEERIRPIRFRDIVILLRSTSSRGETYMEMLKKYEIPAQVSNQTGYFEATEVKTVLSFLSLLDNAHQDIPLAAVLRSPLVGLSDETMLEIRNRDRKMAFHEVFFQYANEHKENEKLQNFLELLGTYRQRATYLSIHELLTQFLDETKYMLYVSALPEGAVRKANLEKLVDMAISYEHSSFQGLFRFVHYIENAKKYESEEGVAEIISENQDAVRIMTVHKSKGLEFPVVFVCGMGSKIGHTSRSSAIFHANYGLAMDCVDPKERIKYPSFYKEVLKHQMEREERGEELRVLYVALTRAREKLILTGVAKNFVEPEIRAMDAKQWMNYTRREGATTYLDWLLPILYINGREQVIQVLDEQDAVQREVKTLLQLKAKKEELQQASGEAGILHFTYPYPVVSKYKNKYSVSEIKHKAMEKVLLTEDTGRSEELHIPAVEFQEETTTDFEPTIPHFMQDTQTQNEGALRGTAMHRYMECFDFRVDDLAKSFDAQMKRMVDTGKVTLEQKDRIQKSKVEQFLMSDLARRMQDAAKLGNLFVERAFVFGDRPSHLFAEEEMQADPVEEPLIMVQGIIDAFFMEEDGVVLLDYKTDRVKNGKQLADLYRKQMDLYADAIQRAYQMPVKERYLYSFALGETVSV